MHYAVISDVHANLEAIEAVLKDIKKRTAEGIIFLGDAVGYGPNPNECMAILNEKCRTLIAGNHDRAVAGLTDIGRFNEYAVAAILWTREVLTDKNKKIIEGLPIAKEMKKNNVLLVHSTPKEPDAWHYLYTLRDAEINFNFFDEKICFVGHSHQPAIIERMPSGEMVVHRDKVDLNESSRYIINAGSVGQPRDRDPRACYAIMTERHVELVRVEYNIRLTQRKMREADLPLPLIERLERGT